MKRITAETRIAGVVGRPVRHSLSPVIHNAWIDAAGLDAAYLAFATPEHGFETLVNGLRGQVVLGLNVTIPFKERAHALADHRTAAAERAGAANLLVFGPEGGVSADNTDGVGLLGAVAEAGGLVDLGPVVVLGAGGAARGAVLSLLDAGVAAIRLVNRSAERAKAIAAVDARVSVLGWDEADGALDGVSAVINATSLGMTGQPPLVLSLDRAPRSAVVVDMVYQPLKTEFLKSAETRGHRTADGLSMLIAQARPSFQAFFGRPPPADVDVRALCEQALDGS